MLISLIKVVPQNFPSHATLPFSSMSPKSKKETTEAKKNELKQAREKVKEEILEIKPLRILSEVVYHDLSLKYGEMFEAGTGAEV